MSEKDDKQPSDEAAARDAAYDVMGLDAFQRIAVADILRDAEPFAGMPAPGSPEEARLIAIGRILFGKGLAPLDPGPPTP